jgi:hypothetical protein
MVIHCLSLQHRFVTQRWLEPQSAELSHAVVAAQFETIALVSEQAVSPSTDRRQTQAWSGVQKKSAEHLAALHDGAGGGGGGQYVEVAVAVTETVASTGASVTVVWTVTTTVFGTDVVKTGLSVMVAV